MTTIAECERACKELKLRMHKPFLEGALCFKHQVGTCKQTGKNGGKAILICRKGKLFLKYIFTDELLFF